MNILYIAFKRVVWIIMLFGALSAGAKTNLLCRSDRHASLRSIGTEFEGLVLLRKLSLYFSMVNLS